MGCPWAAPGPWAEEPSGRGAAGAAFQSILARRRRAATGRQRGQPMINSPVSWWVDCSWRADYGFPQS
jgi:hypothetical protein